MDLAPVIAINFINIFSGLSRGVTDPLNPSLVTPASIVPTRATNKVRNVNALTVMLRLTTRHGIFLSSNFEIF